MVFPLSRIIFAGYPSYILYASKIYKLLEENGPSLNLKRKMLWILVNPNKFHSKTDL
jgi:hypothetical protein